MIDLPVIDHSIEPLNCLLGSTTPQTSDCTGELSEQNDLFRLTYALELAKQYDWVYHILSDSE
ncbi:hypothetical protein ACSN7O_004840 [Enterobacter chuandaensis]